VACRGKARIPRIVDGGLPAVLSQTFRSMIHSRMELGMKHYERAYPDTDIVLIEPDHRDPELYLANTFSYRQRRSWPSMPTSRQAALLRSAAQPVAQAARHGISLTGRAGRPATPPAGATGASPTRIGRASRRCTT
jgi:NTE family protein